MSGSSEDDEVGAELTQEIEKKFYKTLSCLKQKDPRIYDENVRFFEENDVEKPKKKEKKEKPVFIKDYERKLLLEKGGHVSDSDIEENDIPRYVMCILIIVVIISCNLIVLQHILRSNNS